MSLVSKQHLMYTTALTAASGPGGMGGVLPNQLSVANRYLYTLDATHLSPANPSYAAAAAANGTIRQHTKGVDFVLPPPPHHLHNLPPNSRNFNNHYHLNGGIANPMMMKRRFGAGSGSDSDDDYGPRSMAPITGNGGPGGGGGPPSIFLTVPQAGPGAMFGEGVPYGVGPQMIDPNASLTTLFRSYTQSNLSALNSATPMNSSSSGSGAGSGNAGNNSNNATVQGGPGSRGGGGGGGGPLPASSTNIEKDFNYDIGNLSYSPSLKDLADAELHHILNEAMFKPFKHVSFFVCLSLLLTVKFLNF